MFKNFVKVVKYLRRDPKHLRRFLLKRLATSGTVRDGVLILRGRHPQELLQKKIDEYVAEFVLCKICGCPETELVEKRGNMYLQCQAVLDHNYQVENI